MCGADISVFNTWTFNIFLLSLVFKTIVHFWSEVTWLFHQRTWLQNRENIHSKNAISNTCFDSILAMGMLSHVTDHPFVPALRFSLSACTLNITGITRSNFIRYCMEDSIRNDNTYVILRTHKRRPISRPHGRALGRPLWVFRRNMTLRYKVHAASIRIFQCTIARYTMDVEPHFHSKSPFVNEGVNQSRLIYPVKLLQTTSCI